VVDFKEKILVAAGWKPGWSTDYDAVEIAVKFGAKTVINLSNITYAYDSDPKENPDAKPLKRVGWKQFRGIVGDTWMPGLNKPFDPVASRIAQKHDLNVVIMDGKNIDNLHSYLQGEDFVGTVIHPDE